MLANISLEETKNRVHVHSCMNCSNYDFMNNYCVALKHFLVPQEGLGRKTINSRKSNRCTRFTLGRSITKNLRFYYLRLIYEYMVRRHRQTIFFKSMLVCLGHKWSRCKYIMRELVRNDMLRYHIVFSQHGTYIRAYYIPYDILQVLNQSTRGRE